MEYPYEAPPEQRSRFVAAVHTLRIGDTRQHAESVLGRAFDEKSIRGKKIDDPVTGSILTYYLKRLDRNLVNEKRDEYLSLVFDVHEKLVRMTTNVAGLSLPTNGENPLVRPEPDTPRK